MPEGEGQVDLPPMALVEQGAGELQQLQLQQTAEPILEVVAVGLTLPATGLAVQAVQEL